jgi:hypothetical protein
MESNMATIRVYVTHEGLEKLALGQKLYSWHYGIKDHEDDPIPEHSKLVGEFEPNLPTPAECVQPVLAKLAEKEAQIQADAYADVKALNERRQNLLSLTYATP